MSILEAISTEYRALSIGKISHKPNLDGRVHIIGEPSDRVGLMLDEYADYARVYQCYVWVRKAISKTAEQFTPLRVRVVDSDGEEIKSHPITELLDSTNDQMSPAELWEHYIVNMLLAGEAPFELVNNARGLPVEIWPRRPDRTWVSPDLSRPAYPSIASFAFAGEDGDESPPIDPSNVWFDRFLNPLNQWRGLSVVAAVREGVTIDLFAQAWSKTFLKRGARPDYALVAQAGLTQTEREEYEATLMEKFSGSGNWHKPIILEEGISDIKTFSFPPKDIEWLAQREMSRDEVGGVFGMPDEIMGYGRDTYENFDNAWRVWWLLSLKPLCDHRDNSLQSFFTKFRPMLRAGEHVETDLSEIGVLHEDITPKIDNAVKLWNIGIPFNTLDDRLKLGFGPVPGGELPYGGTRSAPAALPTNAPPMDEPPHDQPPTDRPTSDDPAPMMDDAPQQAAYLPAPKAAPLDTAAFARWRSVALARSRDGKSPARPYFDEVIPTALSYELATVLGLCRRPSEVGAVFDHLPDYLNIKATIGERNDIPPERLTMEDEFWPELQHWLDGESRRIFDQVRTHQDAPDNSFWRAEIVLLSAFLAPFVDRWAAGGISLGVQMLADIAVGVDADVNARAATWAGQYALDLARGMTGTTKELARAKISNFFQSGRPLDSLSGELAQIIAPRWRAELVAATEVTRAFAQAQIQIAQEVNVIKLVIWQTAMDERVCPICGPLQGQAAPVGGVFEGGYGPPPAHPKCRCGLAFGV